MRNILPFLIVMFLVGCQSSDQPVPSISFGEADVDEGNENHVVSLPIEISSMYDQDITLMVETKESSAKADLDYISVSGTVTIPAGSLSATIDITIVGDENLELTEVLYVVLTENGNESEWPITIHDDDSYTPQKVEDGYITPLEYPSMELVWSDEFDGEEVNTDNWGYNIGNGCDEGICGWGNEELESYTDDPENVFIEDGKLVIRALNEPSYTSARLLSDGKQEFQYGRIDFRAKLPAGQGIWPALWMLGTNIEDVGWPRCGEIDIMEMVGNHPNTVVGTAHYDANGYASKTSSTNVSAPESLQDDFHVYSILWERNSITWLFDYQTYNSITQTQVGVSYPFNQSFYFIMNVAIGGRWPGNPDETTVFPQEMVVDYVRVYR